MAVGRIPKIHTYKCFIEPYSFEELKNIPREMKAVWNKRDLKTGRVKSETFKEAKEIHKGWICQASLLKTKDDIWDRSDAVLAGQNLLVLLILCKFTKEIISFINLSKSIFYIINKLLSVSKIF